MAACALAPARACRQRALHEGISAIILPLTPSRCRARTLCLVWCGQIFPRPALDAALERRRCEREEATRQAKASAHHHHHGRRSCSPDSSERRLLEGRGGEEAAGLCAVPAVSCSVPSKPDQQPASGAAVVLHGTCLAAAAAVDTCATS